MGKLTQPVLVLVNTGDMLYDMAARTMEMFPHFSYAGIQGGGVDIADQMPEVWSQEVAAYLKSLV